MRASIKVEHAYLTLAAFRLPYSSEQCAILLFSLWPLSLFTLRRGQIDLNLDVWRSVGLHIVSIRHLRGIPTAFSHRTLERHSRRCASHLSAGVRPTSVLRLEKKWQKEPLAVLVLIKKV